jgi:hypothetical protein
LRWAREHGCEWDGDTVDAAHDSGCAQTIEYVRVNQCPAVYLHDANDGDDFSDDDEALYACQKKSRYR